MIKVQTETDKVCVAKANEAGQAHLFDRWDELPAEARRRLIDQLGTINFQQVKRLVHDHQRGASANGTGATLDLDSRAPPRELVRLDDANDELRREWRELGEASLRDGRIAIATLAGGPGCGPPRRADGPPLGRTAEREEPLRAPHREDPRAFEAPQHRADLAARRAPVLPRRDTRALQGEIETSDSPRATCASFRSRACRSSTAADGSSVPSPASSPPRRTPTEVSSRSCSRATRGRSSQPRESSASSSSRSTTRSPASPTRSSSATASRRASRSPRKRSNATDRTTPSGSFAAREKPAGSSRTRACRTSRERRSTKAVRSSSLREISPYTSSASTSSSVSRGEPPTALSRPRALVAERRPSWTRRSPDGAELPRVQLLPFRRALAREFVYHRARASRRRVLADPRHERAAFAANGAARSLESLRTLALGSRRGVRGERERCASDDRDLAALRARRRGAAGENRAPTGHRRRPPALRWLK